MVSHLLMGTYRDGTYWITHYSPLKKMNLTLGYLLFPALSRYLMRSRIQSFVGKYPYYRQEYQKIGEFEQKLEFCLEKETSAVDVEVNM